jgi:prefoldin subunit 5
MKKVFVLLMLVSLAIICACQKKDSAVEQQLTQRKAELAAREEELAERLNSLDEKMNSLNQRVKELAEKETAANARTNPTDLQGQTADLAQLQAEKERIIQQLSSGLPKPPQLDAAEKQRQLEAAGVPPAHQ